MKILIRVHYYDLVSKLIQIKITKDDRDGAL